MNMVLIVLVSNRLSEQLNESSSKFLNRALPPTPHQPATHPTLFTHDVTTSSNGDLCEEIYSDLIDDISVKPAATNGSGLLAPPLVTSARDLNVYAQRASLFNRGASHSRASSISYLADYLEPTNHSLECRPSFLKTTHNPSKHNSAYSDCNGIKNASNSRSTDAISSGSATSSETYVSMIYVNTEMILNNTKPPQDVAEGFRCMAFVNVESLLHVANSIQALLIHQDADIDQQLKFSHFVLKNTHPHVKQGVAAFYNARTYKLKPSDCFLMVRKSLFTRFSF